MNNEIVRIRLLHKKKFQLKDGINFRQLSVPKNRKSKLIENSYLFEREVVSLHNVFQITFPSSWTDTDFTLCKRIWNSLWAEGWR